MRLPTVMILKKYKSGPYINRFPNNDISELAISIQNLGNVLFISTQLISQIAPSIMSCKLHKK